jgi:diguanylate cyclase (GGDEF)-like protein/PAS domain S-box-containing protein
MTGDSKRRGRRLLGAAVLILTIGIVGLVCLNAVLLGQLVEEVSTAQHRMAALTESGREILVLEQRIVELGTRSAPEKVVVQQGLLDRQLVVSIAALPPDSAPAHELTAVQLALNGYDWDRLAATGGRDEALRLSAIDLASAAEHTVNGLRNDAEQQFYQATIQSLQARQRGQVGLAALVAVVLGLGVAGMWTITRLSQTRTERAYEAVKDQVAGRHAAEEALRASEGRFRYLVHWGSDITVLTDDAGRITYISPAVESMLGHRPDDLVDHSLLDRVDAAQRPDVERAIATVAEQPGRLRKIELRLCGRDGAVRLVEAVCQNLVDEPGVGGLVWNGRDVTDRRTLEDALTHQADHDSLTGLPNRVLLLKRLGAAVRTGSAARPVSVVLVDLDGFKHVNDMLGHPAGDEMLRVAGQRLLDYLGPGDTAARLGGDEFAVVFTGRTPGQVKEVSDGIVEVLGQPFTVVGREVRVSASIGIAHCTGVGSTADLLRDAGIAMYLAKNTGKGRIEVFEPDMRARALCRTSLQQDVARAVELGEIDVHYQPIVDLKSFRPVTLEALARWRRPDRSVIPAGVFIPIAEETGAIIEIGREVLGKACLAVQLWRRSLPDCAELGVAVNVSTHQVLCGRLIDHVAEALRDSGLPAAALTLEITESVALELSDRVAAEFARLRELGVRIAVDDFGAGYSSLGCMIGLKADMLKIDRTLLAFDTIRRGSLVTAIAELGRTLGLVVVVEGVETPDHLARALEASCDAAQGFHFARPLPFAEVPGFLARRELSEQN